MATAKVPLPPSSTFTRDRSNSPGTRSPRDVSPSAKVRSLAEEEMQKTGSNGYVSSPLRTQQRLASLDDKHLPLLPMPMNGDVSPRPAALPSPSVRWGDAMGGESFPWTARPGETAPAPTTTELVRPKQNSESSEASPRVDRHQSQASGAATPPVRRSVQFSRDPVDNDVQSSPLRKTRTWEAEEDIHESDAAHPTMNSRQTSFFTKLKALASPATPSHSRGLSASTGFMTPNAALSPQSERSEPIYPVEPSEAAEADVEADSEEQDEVNNDVRIRKRRKASRPVIAGSESTPNTPLASRFASFIREHQSAGGANRSAAPSRRTTMSDISESETRAGVSEDEGRDRIKNAWRRGIEGARGLSYSARKHQEGEASETRRPSNLRRLTGITNPDGTSSSPFRMRADRQASSSAQKWRQVKAGLKMLGQRKRDERMRVDHQKSAQLMAELLAGAPAALVFASMFQRDEHNHKKVPVLLEQLKIRIPHSEMRKDKSGDRHLVFQIDLEYGNGPTRMQWVIRRSLQDFTNLHIKYKGQETADKFRHLRGEDKTKAKMPRFPKSAFPYARGARGLFDTMQDEEEDQDPPDNLDGGTGTGGEASGTERPTMAKHKRRKSSFAPPRRTATGLDGASADPVANAQKQKELYNDRQRKKLETYLQQMIRWLIFRPDSTRLCKFLEISALAIRLSAEGGYHGKQGLLTIVSRANQDRRGRIPSPINVFDRHKPRWFLVRHSYIVCVDGPESLTPYDVFLVDSDFRTEKRKKVPAGQQTATDAAKIAADNSTPGKHHLIRLYNSERKLKLAAKSERQFIQFQESLNQMLTSTVWAQKQRFASFAPVRENVHARWLVDGRDHMWQVSKAISNAKDFVYIHDWWLSPELYLRRPASVSQKWRLDRLLQRKAQEGVKIFVIVYRNIESAIPIDSEYTKWSLLDLHENICIQRSPNQFRQNQFFWAHHEKLVVVDNMMAFVGGVDLCFGRWDDPCHSLTDDKLTGFELDCDAPRDSEHTQVWPGKDYSNPRVQDFYALDRPYEEMYDRTKVPRMPWHDIAMQIVGQPARDVGRHFVQRWNYILRQRVPTRPTPVLLPPPEYDQEELDRLGMTGTCQIQILRSCSPWSIGTPNKVEHSIMNAYCHLIKTSEHFVYIENQFYISSCVVEGTPILNKIGDALVERAIRAHENGEKWAACLVIPLMPGFQNSVDSQDGTSVRLIMTCQYRSICRGETSIFGRLRAQGIDPEEYIRFYSLRQWGKIGPRKCLTTEQLYIHAKCMVVDDRTAIIGSANINERSMLGSRDSEVAAVVTDTKMLPSFMGGEPYMVGEFPHTLRKRLMREHLGLDVDAIYRKEQAHREREEQDQEMDHIYREEFDDPRSQGGAATPSRPPPVTALTERNLEAVTADAGSLPKTDEVHGWAGKTEAASSGSVEDHRTDFGDKMTGPRKASASAQRDLDVDGFGFDNMKALVDSGDEGFTDSFIDRHGHETLSKKDAPDSRIINERDQRAARDRSASPKRHEENPVRPPWPTERLDTVALGLPTRSTLPDLPALDDTDIGGPALTRGISSSSTRVFSPIVASMRRPEIHQDCMLDPLNTSFFHDVWNQVAENNTKLYRQVFRCMPDSEVLDWKQYERYNDYNERFMQSQGLGNSKPRPAKDAPEKSGPPGSGGTEAAISALGAGGRSRSKSLIGSALGKLRPGSKGSEETQTAEMTNEKDTPTGQARAPDSPTSRGSSDPTAVPSDPASIDEKEAAKHADPDTKPTDGGAAAADEKSSLATAALDGTITREDTINSATRQRTVQYSDTVNHAPETTATASSGLNHSNSQTRRRRANTKGSVRPPAWLEEVLSREDAEGLLNMVQGHLVTWPYDWLEKEERGGNWLYNIDQLAPLEIYD